MTTLSTSPTPPASQRFTLIRSALRSVWQPRAIIIGMLVGVIVAAVVFALFCLTNRAALHRDLPAARAHVAQAFVEGNLQDRDYLKGDTDLGWHQYNDCLILHLALQQRAGIDALTVSPLARAPTPPQTQCAILHQLLGGARTQKADFYHRYIHGHTLLVRLLLPKLSVLGIRTLYHATLTLLVLAGIVTGLIAVVRRRRPVQGLFWLVVFLTFARWFGLESFGQSLSHGPADIVLLVYLLFLAICGVRNGIGSRTAILSAALFGAMTMTFEFLTGGIPLGLAAVIGGLAFAWGPRWDAAPQLVPVAPLTAFCTAVIGTAALKILLVAQVFGWATIGEYSDQLQVRMGLNIAHSEQADLGLFHMAKQLAKGIEALAAGMPLMAAGFVLIALFIGLWGARRLIATGSPAMRARTIALILSNAAIAAVLLGFWQHTLVHAWFMERTLAWTIASGFALFLLALRDYPTEPGAGSAR